MKVLEKILASYSDIDYREEFLLINKIRQDQNGLMPTIVTPIEY